VTEEINLLQSALKLAKRGFAVVPICSVSRSKTGKIECGCYKKSDCSNIGKHPCYKKDLIEHGVKNATKDEDLINMYWKAFPIANIGIATGKVSRIIVLDIDPRHGGDTSLSLIESKFSEIPKNLCVKTGGGGLHIYLPYPDREEKIPNNPTFMGLHGIEVKSDGGLVNAPPSLHASGERYTWKI